MYPLMMTLFTIIKRWRDAESSPRDECVKYRVYAKETLFNIKKKDDCGKLQIMGKPLNYIK